MHSTIVLDDEIVLLMVDRQNCFGIFFFTLFFSHFEGGVLQDAVVNVELMLTN